MTGVEFVTDALAPLGRFKHLDEQVAVPTHCLYPSSAMVTVYVTGGRHGARVSDEGGAIDELSTHQRSVNNPDKFLRRFCKPAGLNSQEGKIYSPTVTPDQLPAAVLFVANASCAAAHWGMENIKLKKKRDLRKDLHRILGQRYPKSHIDIDKRLAGKSSRTYTFQNIVRIGGSRTLIADAVLPDSNSINAHAIAHMDVARLDDRRILQRLVYDEDDEWRAADLNLLQMAATLVPISHFAMSLEKLMPH